MPHITVKLLFVLLFIICEFLAAVGVPSTRVNLVALGLFFFGLSLIL